MKRLTMGLIAAVFAATAMAQTTTPTDAKATEPAATTKDAADAKAARRKAGPENLKAATSGTAKGYTQSAGEAASKAAATTDTPKTAPHAAAKREAVKSATSATEKGHTQAAGEAAAKAKGDTTPRPVVPKPQAGTPEMQKVVP